MAVWHTACTCEVFRYYVNKQKPLSVSSCCLYGDVITVVHWKVIYVHVVQLTVMQLVKQTQSIWLLAQITHLCPACCGTQNLHLHLVFSMHVSTCVK